MSLTSPAWQAGSLPPATPGKPRDEGYWLIKHAGMRSIKLWGKESFPAAQVAVFLSSLCLLKSPLCIWFNKQLPAPVRCQASPFVFPFPVWRIVLFTGISRNKIRIELFCPLFLRGAVAVLVHLDLKLALEGVYCVFVCIFALWRFQFVPSSLVLAIKYIPSSLPSSSSGLFKTNKQKNTLLRSDWHTKSCTF